MHVLLFEQRLPFLFPVRRGLRKERRESIGVYCAVRQAEARDTVPRVEAERERPCIKEPMMVSGTGGRREIGRSWR